MSWYLDFVGFQFEGSRGFIVKEIAILSSSGDRCYNYFVTGPKQIYTNDFKTYNYQFDMHNLRWEWGDYEFDEAMWDIQSKVKCDTVYVKGKEKRDFISGLLPGAQILELQYVPAFKHLNSCTHERCDVKHGNHCARRKVYELKHVVDSQDLSR
jgi:hypothetical protein